MIGWSDVYKVVAAMAPLYFALGLGYGSVRWWKLFTADQCDAPATTTTPGAPPPPATDDVEDGAAVEARTQSLWPLVRAVWLKVARNPNVYAGVFGVAWSCVTNRWHVETPSIIEGSVLIMSKTGVGLAMFSMGLFMALQEKIIVCGAGPTVLGMALRFVAGPAATAVGALALGLRGDVLRLAIIQGYIWDTGVIARADRVLHHSRIHPMIRFKFYLSSDQNVQCN
ncbi:hypothetical protein ABZP36_035471 [Zizania latifolia]